MIQSWSFIIFLIVLNKINHPIFRTQFRRLPWRISPIFQRRILRSLLMLTCSQNSIKISQIKILLSPIKPSFLNIIAININFNQFLEHIFKITNFHPLLIPTSTKQLSVLNPLPFFDFLDNSSTKLSFHPLHILTIHFLKNSLNDEEIPTNEIDSQASCVLYLKS